MNKTCSIKKIENGFLVVTATDSNDYSNQTMYSDGECDNYLPVVNKTVFAGSPDQLGSIIVEFYSE